MRTYFPTVYTELSRLHKPHKDCIPFTLVIWGVYLAILLLFIDITTELPFALMLCFFLVTFDITSRVGIRWGKTPILEVLSTLGILTLGYYYY